MENLTIWDARNAKIIENNQIRWVQLTEPKSQYTIKELVEATKAIAPEIWKN